MVSSPLSLLLIPVSGTVSRRSLTDLMKDKTSTPSDDISGDRLDSSVTCMKVVGLEKRYLVAGDEDGVVRIWDEKWVTCIAMSLM